MIRSECLATECRARRDTQRHSDGSSRAAATAALSAAWTTTLAARSVATRVTVGPVRRGGRELGGRRHGRGVEAVGAGEGDEVGAVRRAEQLLEALRRERRRLRQEREDPAAVVVDDDDAQVDAAAGAAP